MSLVRGTRENFSSCYLKNQTQGLNCYEIKIYFTSFGGDRSFTRRYSQLQRDRKLPVGCKQAVEQAQFGSRHNLQL